MKPHTFIIGENFFFGKGRKGDALVQYVQKTPVKLCLLLSNINEINLHFSLVFVNVNMLRLSHISYKNVSGYIIKKV